MRLREIKHAASQSRCHSCWRARITSHRARGQPRLRCLAAGAQDQASNLQHKARQLLEDSPEALERLQAVDDAAAVVARLQEERAKVERLMQAQAASTSTDRDNEEQSAKRDALIRDVQEALQDMAEAQERLTSARFERSQLQDQVDRDADRIESAKAGAVAALGGLVAELPFALSGDRNLLTLAFVLGSAALSAALLGIVLRYAARENWSDGQLKQGVIMAGFMVVGLPNQEYV
ncbi:hypothetical protein WJX73_005050 [Symbiochloris irregularis]|uniref:Uncharacterized protein n=1 Tax=Symbiochloris irregularis TaxID=706552 RepID=A0AAW1PIZ5_9CHLO